MATVLPKVSSMAVIAASFSPMRTLKSDLASRASRTSVSPSCSLHSSTRASSLASSAAFAARIEESSAAACVTDEGET